MKKSLKEILAPMSKEERIQYIWHYYKFHILGVIALIIVAIVTINSINNKKDIAINVMIVGEMIDTEKVSDMRQALNEELLDLEEQESSEVSLQAVTVSAEGFDPQMQAGLQKMMAELSAGYIDVLYIDKSFFDQMNTDGQLLDIQQLYGDQSLPLSDEYLYFAEDQKTITGINIAEIKPLKNVIYDDNIIMCIPANTKKQAFITRYLQHLLK